MRCDESADDELSGHLLYLLSTLTRDRAILNTQVISKVEDAGVYVFLSKKKESFSRLSQEGTSLHNQFKTLNKIFAWIPLSLGSSLSRASAGLSAGRWFESGMIHQYFFAMFPYFTQYLAIEITFGAQFPSRFTSQPACQKSAVFGHFHNC